MVRIYRPLICLMIALFAFGGTAMAAGSLTGSLSGSVESDDASLGFGGDADADAGDGVPTVDGGLDVAASAHGHDVAAGADTDGNAYAAADDHSASANIDADGQSGSLTVDGTTVSTDDVGTNVDIPGAPDLPDTHGSIGADIMASISATAQGFAASITAAIGAMFSW